MRSVFGYDVVAESLYSREVFQTAQAGVHRIRWVAVVERLVHAEVMRIAMNVNHRLFELLHCRAQSYEEGFVSFHDACRYWSQEIERFRVADRFALDGMIVEAGIRLRNEHHRNRISLFGDAECVLHPGDHRGLPDVGFLRIRMILAAVIAGALDVQRRVRYAVILPTPVFHACDVVIGPGIEPIAVDVWCAGTRFKREARSWNSVSGHALHFLVETILPKRIGRAEEKRPLMIEPFEGIERAIGCSVAIGPVIIARGECGGCMQHIQIRHGLDVLRVGTGGWRY